MDCPRCSVEMAELKSDDLVLNRCAQCGGLWGDVADVNRLLLHNNMPALQSLGGRVNPDAAEGQCPDCHVDLLAVEGGDRRSLRYDTCESCGGIFFQVEGEVEGVDAATAFIVDFYKRFRVKGAVAL